jgi:hypothetical protein
MWQQNSNSIPTAGMLRDELTYSILWQGDPFSCSKGCVLFLSNSPAKQPDAD